MPLLPTYIERTCGMKPLRRVVGNESYFDYYDFDQNLSDKEACEQVWK